jgi:hypothetical protein
MQEHERLIRPALGAIVLICFFMPFLKISCAGQPIASITGLDMAMGKTVEPPNFFDQSGNSGFGGQGWNNQPSGSSQSGGQYPFGDSTVNFDQSASTDQANPFGNMGGEDMKIESKPEVAAALALAVIALLGAFAGAHRAMVFSALASGITAVLLLTVKASAGSDLPPEMEGVISIQWSTGFWGAVAGSVALAIFTFSTINQNSSRRQKPRLVIQTQYDKQNPELVNNDIKTS